MIGRTIGRYRIVGKLSGEGDECAWRAEDPVLQRVVGLKFLAEGAAPDAAARRRFVRGARRATSRLPTIYDAGEEDGRIYIAYRLEEGDRSGEAGPEGPLLRSLARARMARGLAWLGLAVIAAGVAGTWWLASRQLPRYDVVAVLPLANLSDDPEESYYLSDSIGDLLAARLTQLEGLRVTPWVTARGYAGDERAPGELAGELGVDALVMGSFRMAGGRVQGTLSLVDAESELAVWTRPFDEPTAGVVDLLGPLAVELATALRGGLARGERETLGRPPSASAEAFQMYVRGADLLQASEQEAAYAAALRLFEKAVELDPGLALAHVGIGAVHTAGDYNEWPDLADLDRAEESFLRALELDPRLTRAYGGLVRVHMHRGGELAEDEMEECLRVGRDVAIRNPDDADALVVRAEAYTLCGLPDRAVAAAERALELDPASQAARFFLFLASAWSERHAQAIRVGEDYLQRFGPDPEITGRIGDHYLALGMREETRQAAERHLALFPEQAFDSAYLLRALGETERAKRIAEEFLERRWEEVNSAPYDPKAYAEVASETILFSDAEDLEAEVDRILARVRETDCHPHVFVGGALFDRGHVRRGIALWQEALDRGCIVRTWGRNDLPPSVTQDPAYLAFTEESRRRQARLRAVY